MLSDVINWTQPFSGWELLLTALIGFFATSFGVLSAFELDRRASRGRSRHAAIRQAQMLVEAIDLKQFANQVKKITGVEFREDALSRMEVERHQIVSALEAVSPEASKWFALELLLFDSVGDIAPIQSQDRVILRLSRNDLQAELRRMDGPLLRRRRPKWFADTVDARMLFASTGN